MIRMDLGYIGHDTADVINYFISRQHGFTHLNRCAELSFWQSTTLRILEKYTEIMNEEYSSSKRIFSHFTTKMILIAKF